MEQGTDIYNGIQQTGLRRYEVFFAYSTEKETPFQLRQTVEHKPTLEEVKQVILGHINQVVQDKILMGLSYADRIVWLSAENQRNIAFAYTLAKGGDLTVMPTLKLGTDDDYIYYTFTDTQEVIDFARLAQLHIGNCLAEGRALRDRIDWSNYVI